jgi:hypothetical protein
MQILVIGIVFVIAVAGAWLFKGSMSSSPTNTAAVVTETVPGGAPQPGTPVNPGAAATAPATRYKDGSYSSTGAYTSPAGPESVEISITLVADIVTNATFKGLATHKMSIANQKKFADGFSAEVVGKPIDSINLTVVNGSSLTGTGFMDALSKIKSQAM